jgi:hypothetical protein
VLDDVVLYSFVNYKVFLSDIFLSFLFSTGKMSIWQVGKGGGFKSNVERIKNP